jgi:PAS domain S-box-containing protein
VNLFAQTKSYYLRASSIGISSTTTVGLARRVRVTNQLALASVAFTLGAIPYQIMGRQFFLALIDLPVAACYLLILFLNAKKRFYLSRFLFLFLHNGLVFGWLIILGHFSGLYFLFLTFVVLPVILFELRDRKTILVWATLPIALFFISGSQHFLELGRSINQQGMGYLYLYCVIITFVSNFVYMVYVQSNNLNYEQRLIESQQRMALHFDQTSLGVVEFNVEGRITKWNRAAETIFGYTAEQSIGQMGRLILTEKERARVHLIWESQPDRTASQTIQVENRTRDGLLIQCEWNYTGLVDLHGKLIGIAALIKDISVKSFAAEALRKSEENLRSLVETAGEGIFTLDTSGRITFSNQRFAQMMGYAVHELMGKAASQLVHPDSISLLAVGLARRQSGIRDSYELKGLCKDGTTTWLQASLSPIFDKQGNFEASLAMFTDITERKLADAKIAKQQLRIVASSKMSALGEMASGIAHEINNPLAIIHGKARLLIELASQGVPDSLSVLKSAEKIAVTAMRISKIVNALRSFARDGEHDPFQNYSINAILEETSELCKERFKQHSIQFRMDTVPANLCLECRPVQISQVLLNILNNAHDAVEKLPNPWVQVSIEDRGDWIAIVVKDSGKGVPADLRENIFLPFFTTKEVGSGTGLGLSVAYGIVESHHGTLVIDAKCAHTSFVVTFPKRQTGSSAKSVA